MGGGAVTSGDILVIFLAETINWRGNVAATKGER